MFSKMALALYLRIVRRAPTAQEACRVFSRAASVILTTVATHGTLLCVLVATAATKLGHNTHGSPEKRG